MDKKIVSRLIFPQIINHLEEKEITVIIGPRQVGKTTLLFQLKDELINKKKISPQNIYYFNLDLISDFEIFKKQTDFIQFIKNRLSKEEKLYLLIDEVQRIENTGLFFKGIYDLQLPIKLILTGSSSLEIRSKIVEPLTGRKRIFKLFPLSFYEYLSFWDKELLPFLNKKQDIYTKEKILLHLYNFILFGGYPKIATEKDLEKKAVYLEEIFVSYLEKDVVGLLRIKNSFIFSKLVRILAEEMGNLVDIEHLASEIRIKNETIKNYLSILEETFILYRLHPFFKSTRTEIRKRPKIYFFDTGIRNFAKYFRDISLRDFIQREDKGILLENFIFSELIKLEMPINFWRTKDGAEVDFIISKQGRSIPIEVKATEDKNLGISRSFLSFIKKYKPKIGVVINLGSQGKRKIDNTVIYYCLPYEITLFTDFGGLLPKLR